MADDATVDNGSVESVPDGQDDLFPFDTAWIVKGFYLFVLVWLVFLALELSTWDRKEDRVFPLLIISVGLVLVAIQLVKLQFPALVDRFTPTPPGDDDTAADELQERLIEILEGEGRPPRERQKYEIRMLVWVIALVPLAFLFGFRLTLPLYVFTMTYYLDRNLKRALAAAAIFSVVGYVLFIIVLNVPLWRGTVFGGGIG